MKTYLCSYNYEGGSWSFQIQAQSFADAQARLDLLYFAKVDGELVAEIPAWAAGGIISRLLCWWKNRVRGIGR